jgi:hypothetical protein
MARRDSAEASGRLLDEAEILLLTIHLPDGKAYACDQRENITSRGIVFLGGIEISKPQDDGKPVEISIGVPNVGNRLANLVETTEESVKLTLEVISDTEPDVVRQSYEGLMIRSAEIGLASGSFTLRQDIPVDEPVSGLRATGEHFPGIEYAF